MSELTSPERAEMIAPLPPTARAPKRRGAGNRLFWTFADQGLSSIQNAGLSIVLARSVDAHQFGAFSLVFTVYGLVIALSGALAGQVLVIRFAAARGAVRRQAVSSATGTALFLGLLAGVGMLIGGGLQTGSLRGALLVTAVVFPGLLLQDAWRTVFISRGTPFQAFANDALWLLLQIIGIGVLELTHATAIWSYLVAWGAAACVAAAVGVRQSGARPRPLSGPAFVRSHAGVAGPSLASSLTAIGA